MTLWIKYKTGCMTLSPRYKETAMSCLKYMDLVHSSDNVRCWWPFFDIQVSSFSHVQEACNYTLTCTCTRIACTQIHILLFHCLCLSLLNTQLGLMYSVPLSDTAHRQTFRYMNTFPQCEVTRVTQGRPNWHQRVVMGVLVRKLVLTSVSVLTSQYALNSQRPNAPTHTKTTQLNWTC